MSKNWINQLKNNDPSLVKLFITVEMFGEIDIVELGKLITFNTHIKSLTLICGYLASTTDIEFVVSILTFNSTILKLDINANILSDYFNICIMKALSNNRSLLHLDTNNIGENFKFSVLEMLQTNTTLLKIQCKESEMFDLQLKRNKELRSNVYNAVMFVLWSFKTIISNDMRILIAKELWKTKSCRKWIFNNSINPCTCNKNMFIFYM